MTSNAHRPAPNAPDVLTQRIVPTLHGQRWSLDQAPVAHLHRLIMLGGGQGTVTHADGTRALRALDVVWLPAGTARTLAVGAGSTGLVAGFSEAMVAAAIGAHADSTALRYLTASVSALNAHEAGATEELRRALDAIDRESRRTAPGSWHYLSAHLSIVLVLLWRQLGAVALVPATLGHAASVLQRFRHLVEAQYREHWTVARYAQALAMSADSLHDLCARKLGRVPSELVHQRVVREACVLLNESARSVDQVGTDLGFKSASHFSRFFKRWMGASPRRFRDEARTQAAQGLSPTPYSYADWP